MKYLAKNIEGKNKLHSFESRQERTKAINEALNKGFKAIIYKLRKRKTNV